MQLKPNKIRILMVTSILILLVILAVTRDKKQMWDYYSTEDSFLSTTGVVTYIHHAENQGQIYLSFSDIDPVFHDKSFKIVGKNYTIVIENGLLDRLSIGDHVEFVGSPRVFGDGYVLPLIAISLDGVQYIEREQGYQNFLEWLRSNL